LSRRRIVALTVTVAVLVPAFLALGWWQLTRAMSGNSLSWAYTFEWPLFAGYLVWVWRRLLREERESPTGTAEEAPSAGADVAPPAEEEDEELAAYNRYLAALEESGRRKRW
jgi:DNA-binding transcriptional regulator of glucitol operon